jgi:hypothetical protein
MAIKLIEGKVLCSLCGKLMEKEESFKINEFQYEIACLDCDRTSNFSKNNFVNCSTAMKLKLINLIENSRKYKKTMSLDMTEARRMLVNYLSTKIKAIPK